MALRAETGYNHGLELSALSEVEEAERIERIRRAWSYYQGDAPKALRVPPGAVDDNVGLSSGRTVVDVGVSFLFGGELGYGELHEDIEAMLQVSGGPLTWQRLGVSGALGGTAFLRLRPSDDGPRLVVLDPASTSVIWNPSDHEDVVGYIITWLESRGDVTVACRQRILRTDAGGWVILDEESVEDSQWRLISEEAWPWEWCPVDHCQNLPMPHEVYGLSDLEPDVLALCRTVDRTASNLNRILRLYSHPRTVGTGIGSPLDLEANPGKVVLLDNPSANLYNLEMQSDMASSLRFHELMCQQLYQLCRVPEVATGKLDSAGQLSSLALRVMYGPLIAKTQTKQRTYGGLIERVLPRALEMAGITTDRVRLEWPSLVPVDEEAIRRTAIIDQQLGVSRDTLLERLGYDPETERTQRADDRSEAQEAFNAGTMPPGVPDDDA